MTKFRTLDKVSNEKKSTKFELFLEDEETFCEAGTLPNDYVEVIFLGKNYPTGKDMFLAIDEDGDRFFYLGTKGLS